MESLRHKPVALWRLDDTSPFQDYSGYSRVGSLVGTASHGLALTADAAYSQKLSSSAYAQFSSPVFIRGGESQPFSLAATICVTGDGTEQQILSHDGLLDGLTVDGNTVHFSTDYANTGVAKCSHNLGVRRRVDIVGVHTQNKNSLYVDGVLVDEVDITTEQTADTYAHVDSDLYSGQTATGHVVMVNNIALYAHALQPENISSMHRANIRRAPGNVPSMFSGDDIFVSSTVRPASISMSWDTEEDWQTGMHEQTVVDNGQLVAQMKDGVTVAGTWTDSADLYTGETAMALRGVNMFWYGQGETVEVSLDGETWTQAVKGQNLSIIPVGFDPTDKELYVRVNFDAGLDYAYIDYLQIRGYTSDSVEWDNRLITYTNPIVVGDEHDPMDMRDDWGVNIESGGSLVIGPDTYSDSPAAVNTVEVWVKKNTSPLTHNLTVANTYVNGVLNGTADAGEWHVVHYTVTAGVSGDIVFSGDVQIGKIAFYDSVLSATDISNIVSNYTGIRKTGTVGDGTISLAEPATPVVIYAHDWEIVAS